MFYVQFLLVTVFLWLLIRFTGTGKALKIISPGFTGLIAITIVICLGIGGVGSILYLTEILAR